MSDTCSLCLGTDDVQRRGRMDLLACRTCWAAYGPDGHARDSLALEED
jgi:hypothetical protein